jgi:hypothetical protein
MRAAGAMSLALFWNGPALGSDVCLLSTAPARATSHGAGWLAPTSFTRWGSISSKGLARPSSAGEIQMSQIDNPFARGYQNLRVVRTLLITCEDDSPPVWRPLHASQAHLTDDQVAQFPCLIGQDFALITEDQCVPEELETQCHAEGIVRSVVYAVPGTDFYGKSAHVGDTYSEQAARELVHRFSFQTGFYSRCWEISSAHLDANARHFLAELADTATPSLFLFIAFRVPYCPAIGVKLIATPWTDDNLRLVEGITAKRLRQEHRRKGVPQCLAEVLHLAALADVRMLLFDADAQVLDGLPLYDNE